MSRSLHGMRAMVTGGAQGIGAVISQRLSQLGVSTLIVDKQGAAAEDVSRALCKNAPSASFEADIARSADCEAVVDALARHFDGLDILINNAAPARDREFIDRISLEEWNTHQDVVIKAAAELTEKLAPQLAESGRGCVVNISSVAAQVIATDHCSWAYHVSKAGLEQLTRYMACRHGANGIRVNAVAPGLIDREDGRKTADDPQYNRAAEIAIPLGRAGRAIDVANVVTFLCSREAAYVTGQVLVVDGGLGLAGNFGTALRGVRAGLKEH